MRERAAIDQLEAELEGLMLEMHAILSGEPWRERYEPRERVERLCVEWAYCSPSFSRGCRLPPNS